MANAPFTNVAFSATPDGSTLLGSAVVIAG